MTKLSYEQQQKLLLEMCDILDSHTSMIRRLVLSDLEDAISVKAPVITSAVSTSKYSMKEELLQKLDNINKNRVSVMDKVELVKEEDEEPDPTAHELDYSVDKEKLAHEIDQFKRTCSIGQSIKLKHRDFGDLEFLVAGKNVDAPRSVTLISKHVIGQRMWNGPTACDRCEYEGSDIRKWLNTNFKSGFEIAELIKPVRKKTNTLSKTYNERVTMDFCWLLSREECALRSSAGINPDSKYPLFVKTSDKIRTAKGDYKSDRHITWFLRDNSEYNLDHDGSPHVHTVNTLGSFGKVDPMKTKCGVVVGLVI